MKNRRIWTGGLLAALALGAGACDNDGLTDVNVNPDSPTDAPAPNLFVNATRLGVSRWLGNANLRQWELLAQHFAEVQYPETDAYVRLGAGFTSTNFDAAYAGELKDLEQVIRKGRLQGFPGYWAPAQVMQSWEFGVITDMFGDVPFGGALSGDSVGLGPVRIQPEYDPQEAIYDSIFARLAEATTALDAPLAVTLGAADRLYGGDRAAWQRFSNSLRARHALRMVNVDPARADAELRAAFNAPGGVFTTNAHSARLVYPGAGGTQDNPWWTNFQTRDDHRVSDRLMFYLKGWSNAAAPAWTDPRLPVYAQPAKADGVYRGLANALTHAAANPQLETTSRPGSIFYGGTTSYGSFPGPGASTPQYILANAEVQFIRAEAAARGLGGLAPAQAAGFYEAGIRSSMAQWGVTSTAEIDAYLARPEVAYKGGVEGLRQIATQKWIALYSDGTQAWSEWRRTCQPFNVRPGPEAALSTVPRRLQYSETEVTTNGTNVQAAVARQGADALTTRIWWDRSEASSPTCGA
jgi:hypothetical protein